MQPQVPRIAAAVELPMRVYMPRFHSRDIAANITRLRQDCAEAAEAGCEMALFPEVFMSGYRLPVAATELRGLFAELSAEYSDLLFFFGSLSEDGVNRMPAYLGGQSVAEYDKVHLFLPGGEGELWLRRLFTDPATGELVTLDATSRRFPPAQRGREAG